MNLTADDESEKVSWDKLLHPHATQHSTLDKFVQASFIPSQEDIKHGLETFNTYLVCSILYDKTNILKPKRNVAQKFTVLLVFYKMR